MATKVAKATRKKRVPSKSVRTVRIEDTTWEAARLRGESEGASMSHVMQELLEGYGRGFIALPRVVKQYRASDAAKQ